MQACCWQGCSRQGLSGLAVSGRAKAAAERKAVRGEDQPSLFGQADRAATEPVPNTLLPPREPPRPAQQHGTGGAGGGAYGPPEGAAAAPQRRRSDSGGSGRQQSLLAFLSRGAEVGAGPSSSGAAGASRAEQGASRAEQGASRAEQGELSGGFGPVSDDEDVDVSTWIACASVSAEGIVCVALRLPSACSSGQLLMLPRPCSIKTALTGTPTATRTSPTTSGCVARARCGRRCWLRPCWA
jgi:hypothetical protein